MTDFKDRLTAFGKKLTEKRPPKATADADESAASSVATQDAAPKAKRPGLIEALKAKAAEKKASRPKAEPTTGNTPVSKPAREKSASPNFGEAANSAREALRRMIAKKAKGSAQLPRRAPVTADIRFAVQPDGQRETVWVLSRDNKVTRVGDPIPDESLLVFSNQDFRFATPKAVSYQKALSIALENQGQAVRIANRAHDLKAFYARPLDALPEYEVIAGVQAIDQAVAMDANRLSYPLIAGFQLGLADQAQVVILCHYDDAGDAGRTQVSMNPESLEFVLAQFAATRRVDLTTTPVRVYDGEVFRRAVSGLVAFQDEDPILGLPPSMFYARANKLAAWAAVGAVIAGGFYYTKVDHAESVAEEQTQAAAAVAEEKQDLLARSPSSLGSQLALDGLGALTAAESLYRPGFAITLDTAQGGMGVSISVSASLPAEMPAESRTRLLREIKDLPTPSGCKKSEYHLSSTVNEAKVIYQCNSKTGDFEQYRLK